LGEQEDDDDFRPPEQEPQDIEIADEDDADLEGDSVLGKHPLEEDDEDGSPSKR